MKPFGLLIFITLVFSSCEVDYSSPGKPLIDLSFNGKVINEGLANVLLEGSESIVYYNDEVDTCFNLSSSAKSRKPIRIKHKQGFSLNDYGGFTVSVWLKKAVNDPCEYTVLSQQKEINGKWTGWEITAGENGSWTWIFKDTIQSWSYVPTFKRQPVNDRDWHHLAFSYNKQREESRLYYDGINVAVYSMSGNVIDIDDAPIVLGLSPQAFSSEVEVYNGLLDDFKMWSRPLLDDEIKQVNFMRSKTRIKAEPGFDDELKVMTWSIWQGGVHEGKYVGIERIAEVIKSSGADIIMLQEMSGTGPVLADQLAYHYYQRNTNLGLLSRYPLGESKHVYRSQTSGCVEVVLDDDRSLYACPIWLDPKPKMDAYLKSDIADPDSIVEREMETRGREITFVLGELKRLRLTNKDVPIILAGNFNSGSHLDWTERNKENYSGLVVPFPVSIQMEQSNYKDSYRVTHPDEDKDLGRTWSTKFTSAFSNRKDYIYCLGSNLRPVESYIIEDHAVSFPSDHAAVVSKFIWEK